jgi:SAM-dependent methyltransferase
VRTDRYLSPAQAGVFYDRVGSLQDTQGFYERAVVDVLVLSGAFERAGLAVEVGCGTGTLARQLLAGPLPVTARYVGLEVSPRMAALTRDRIQGWADRAMVALIDGQSPWPVAPASADRVVAAYVLDLLSPAGIQDFFAQARRVLRPGGMVAVASLTPGRAGLARLVSSAWTALWGLRPSLTGGCRPVDVAAMLPPDAWAAVQQQVLTRFGVTSQVLTAVAQPTAIPGAGSRAH